MNIFQKAITPDMPRVLEGEQIYVYVPQATSTNAGIASYKNEDFKVNDGVVLLRWPAKSLTQGPLANPSLIKVQEDEFEYTNREVNLDYEGSRLTSSIVDVQLKRDLRDAYDRPDLVMLDQSYFPREIIEKDGKQYYKYNTTAVHYIVQTLTDAQKRQARENIDAGSNQDIKNIDDKVTQAIINIDNRLDDKASLTEPNVFGHVLNTIPLISTSGILHNLPNGTTSSVILFDDDAPEIQIGNGLTNIKFYGKDSHITYNSHNIALDTDLDNKIDKSGGIFTGNVGVQGNLSVSGTIVTKDTETLKVQDNVIVTNANKIELLDLSGLAINKNDTQTYGIMYDAVDDSVKLGLGSIDSDGKFTFNEGEGSPVATRSDSSSLTDNHLIKWDATNNKLVDSGCSVDSFVTPDYANKNYVPINTSKSYTMPSPYTVYGNIKNSGSVTMESYTGLHYKPSGQNGSRIMLSPKRSLVHSYYSRAQEDEGYLFDNIGGIECENDSTGATVSIQATKYDDSLGNMNTYGSVIDMTDANLRIGSFSNWKGISSSKNITNAKIDINDNGVQVDVAQGLLTYNDSEVVNMNKLNTTSIRYDIEQTLTDEQKAQARANIGAGTGSGTGGGTTVTVGGVAQETWNADSKVNTKVGTNSITINDSGITLANLKETAELGLTIGNDATLSCYGTNTADYIQLTTDNGTTIHHEKWDNSANNLVKSDLLVQDVQIMAKSEFTNEDSTITIGNMGVFQGMISIGSQTSNGGGSVISMLPDSITAYVTTNESIDSIIVHPDKIEIETTKLTYNGNEVATVNQVSSTSVTELIGTEENPINLSTLEKGKMYSLSGVLYSGANFSSATITSNVLASVLAKDQSAVYVEFYNCGLSADDSGNITIGPVGTGAYIITDETGAITIPNNHQLIDESMSDDSTNPVQNKVIKTYIDNLILTTLNTEV